MCYTYDTKRVLVFEPWHGELGWEVLSWVPRCRRIAKELGNPAITSSFPGMEPLYQDFSIFKAHDKVGRSLEYPKQYRVHGEHKRYGNPNRRFDALFHARGVSRKSAINYKQWWNVCSGLFEHFRIASIGSMDDQYVQGTKDMRGIGLQQLMDYMAGTKVVIGQSSGVMHLASSCGASLIVWGDKRTYFGETLERRYRETWNPFNVKVVFIESDDWQPKPVEIIKEVMKFV